MKMPYMAAMFCVTSIFAAATLAQPGKPAYEGPGKIYIVEVNGERVLFQAGYNKFWYPNLSDMFGMSLSQQEAYIDDLQFAGIRDWRIGYYWDTIPLKWSIFERLTRPGPNFVANYATDLYFPYTSETDYDGTISYYTHGRTGNEWGDPESGGNGAYISIGPIERHNLPVSEDYQQRGVPIPAAKSGKKSDSPLSPTDYEGKPRTFYTQIPTEAEDHWVCFSNNRCVFNDDLNYTPQDKPYCQQGVPQNRPCGAWTVSEAFPQFWRADNKSQKLLISIVDHESNSLRPATVVAVWQDEQAIATHDRTRVKASEDATEVFLPASRQDDGNGRVYHIVLKNGDEEFTMKIGVPTLRGNKFSLIDDGRVALASGS